MASTLVALILGAGPRVGTSVAEKFAQSGYKVAVASRSGSGGTNAQGYLSLKADFTKPDSLPALFAAVQAAFHAFPSVIVYNAAALTPPPDGSSLFSTPVEAVAADLSVNTVSAYAAAQEALKGWATLPKEVKKSFIYTGNALNVDLLPVPMMLNLGMGKSATAFWIRLADALNTGKDFRFYYADERGENGKAKGNSLDGPAHGEFYVQLAAHQEGVPWHATFVAGKGYAKV